jgi:hypothetical protein
MTSDSINRSFCNGTKVGVVIGAQCKTKKPFFGLLVGAVMVCESSCLYVCLLVHLLVPSLALVWCRVDYHFICFCFCQVVVGLYVGFL